MLNPAIAHPFPTRMPTTRNGKQTRYRVTYIKEESLNDRDLVAKAAELDRQIASAREVEAAGALAEIKAKIAEFGFTVEEVFSTKKTRKQRTRSSLTYRDPESGATWSGMGRQPR